MMEAITSTVFGTLKGKIAMGLLAFGLIAAGIAIKIASDRDQKMINTAASAGASAAVAAGQKTTLKQNKDASDASNQIRNDVGDAVYNQCLRSATSATRTNCESLRNQPLPN